MAASNEQPANAILAASSAHAQERRSPRHRVNISIQLTAHFGRRRCRGSLTCEPAMENHDLLTAESRRSPIRVTIIDP
jgi:hypothetical protein